MDVSLQFRVLSPGAAPSFLGLANRRPLSASVCWPRRPSAPGTLNTINPCPTCPRIKTSIITASKSVLMSGISSQLSRRGSHRHFPPLGLPALVLGSLRAGSRLHSIVSSAVEPRITTTHPTSGTNSSNTDTNSIPGGTRVGVTLGAFGQRVTASPGERSSGCSSFPQDGDITSPVTLPTEGTVDKFSTIASVDWTDWMLSGSSSSDNADMTMSMSAPFDDRDDGSGASDSAAASTMPAAGAVASLQPAGLSSSVVVTTIRISFYAVAASFDRRQLESRLRTAYGNQSVRKYPDVIHCLLSRSREAQPGTDVFFFDYGVVACWGLSLEVERDIVQNLAVPCAIQPLAERDQQRDVFRCTFCTHPSGALEVIAGGEDPNLAASTTSGPGAAANLSEPLDAFITASAAGGSGGDALGSSPDVEYGTGSNLGTASAATVPRRITRRAERSVGVVSAAVVPPLPPPLPPPQASPPWGPPPAAVGPYSLLSFPPQITDDTVLLHVRHCGDTATLLAVSYALAQSTKLSAFEKAVEAIVSETQGLPEALAEHGQVQLSGKEIGRLIGKVLVLKRSVNLLRSVAETPEFFWYAPDQLQSLYMRITEYVELTERLGQLNGRFDVLQEMLELLRDQEANRHGNRLEWIVIWLIVVEVVLGFFELLELFGVIGPGGGF